MIHPLLSASIIYMVLVYARYFLLLGRGRICNCEGRCCLKYRRYACTGLNDGFKYCMKVWDWRMFRG